MARGRTADAMKWRSCEKVTLEVATCGRPKRAATRLRLALGETKASQTAMIPHGFQWNEAILEKASPLGLGFLVICVVTDEWIVRLIGTAFIVEAKGRQGRAITAAHCLDEIYRIRAPNPRHSLTALPEFVPPPSEFNLDPVRAIYLKDGKIFFCPIREALWDNNLDYAMLVVASPEGEEGLFEHSVRLSDTVPAVGDTVCMIGFGDMEVNRDTRVYNRSRMQFRLVQRIGFLEEIHPDGQLLVRAPCIQTSIPVYGGMSGGLVARWPGHEKKVEAFAIVSHAPEPQPIRDRLQSGHSVAALLNVKVFPEPSGGSRAVISGRSGRHARAKDV